MGFGQGVSGLNAAAQNLDVIGNNIANSATVGFKASTAQFADVYAGSKVGLGVRVNSVVQSFAQGNIESSGRSMDVAITGGNGFYRMVDDAGQVFFTRNGQLQRTDDGFITNAQGLKLTGYPAGSTGAGTQPVPLTVSTAAMPPKPTSSITAQFNLDSGGAVPATAFSTAPVPPATTPSIPTSDQFTYSNTVQLTDSLGNVQQVTQYFVRVATPAATPPVSDWKVYVTDASGNEIQPAGGIDLQFNANGTLNTPPGSTSTLTLTPTNGAAPMTMTYDLTGTTQFAADNDPKKLVQNGYASGSLLDFSVQADGTILGSYSNEQSQNLGQIVLASFGNIEGLKPEGDNVWTATGASGQPLIGTPGGSYGNLQANANEASNVDLSGQLVNLIVAQRNYQANAQTIKAQDTVLQTLVNI